jgi:hypothetical protein
MKKKTLAYLIWRNVCVTYSDDVQKSRAVVDFFDDEVVTDVTPWIVNEFGITL